MKDHVPIEDEQSVANVRKADGVILAKTNTPEFGAGGNTTNRVYGPTGNPFDAAKTCGGSSGGSAVAVALGQVPLATGTDYGGSLRPPAAFCGAVGFRPSPGVVPSIDGAASLSPFRVTVPMGQMLICCCSPSWARTSAIRSHPATVGASRVPRVLQRGARADLSGGVRFAVPAFAIVRGGSQRRENADIHALARSQLAPTMALACAAALPCGVDHLGLPFGIQVIGPNGSDARVLQIAHALEQVLSQNEATSRPVPG